MSMDLSLTNLALPVLLVLIGLVVGLGWALCVAAGDSDDEPSS